MIIYEQENIRLDDNPEENYIQIEDGDFRLQLLDNYEPNKGASSNLFILIDPDDEYDDRVIKICKDPLTYGTTKRLTRFKSI